MSDHEDPERRKEKKLRETTKAHVSQAVINTIGRGPVFHQINSSNKSFPDHYRVFPKLFTKIECERILEQMDQFPFKPSVVGTEKNATSVSEIRRSQVKWVPMTLEFAWVYKKVEEAISTANRELWWFFLDGWREHLQLSMYNENEQGHYEWHMDCGSGFGSGRKVSLTVQLSDPAEYEGGDMQFLITQKPITLSKEQGTAVVFPSYMEHRVLPVTKGKRYSLVIWVTGPVLQ